MSREVEEKTVLRFAAMPADETRERIIKGIIVFCVLHHLHVEAVGLKGSSDRLDILSDSRKLGPSICVVTHPDHKRMAFLVKPYCLSCGCFDFNTLDAAGFSD